MNTKTHCACTWIMKAEPASAKLLVPAAITNDFADPNAI